MRDPLLVPLAAIAAGIAVSRYVPFSTGEILWTLAGFAGLAGLARGCGARRLAVVCVSGALFFCGVWTEVAHRRGPAPELDVEGREIVILGGCVVEPPAISGGRERFVMELARGARAQVTLFAREGQTLPVLRYGQRVDVEARVRTPRNYLNPGGFDYERYLARRDIFWTATAPANAVQVLPGTCGSPFQAAVMGLRVAALARIERLYPGNSYQSGMMQAILLGQSYQLQRVWTENYRATGTFHALVISGTHVAVLAAVLLFLLRILFVPQTPALALAALGAWVYALVVGWQTPCVRSAAGMTLYLVARYCYRRGRILNLLAAVALGFLLLDPEQLFEPSFQLTFLAVAFIGAFAAPLIEATSGPLAHGLADLPDTARDAHLAPRVAAFRLEMRLLAETVRLWTRLPERAACLLVTLPARAVFYVYELVVVSGMIQVGLALPMVVYFHRVGLSGLSANVVVVPLMGLVVPLGFAAVFTGWAWVARLTGLLLALSQAVVDWHARIEPNWRVPTPPLWLAVALPLAIVLAAFGTWRRLRAAAAAAVAALVALLLAHPFPPRVTPGQLEMTAIDVGQGDSLLVASPEGRLMLVDGGGAAAYGARVRTSFDTGEDVVAPYLWSRSIKRLDVMVCTHTHADHIGGLLSLLGAFRVRELWTGNTAEGPEWERLRSLARTRGVRIVPLRAGTRFTWGGTRVEVLAPVVEDEAGPAPKNNDSLVLRLAWGNQAFLLAGDIERQVEWRLFDDNRLSPAAVLKVAHHGSKTSTTEDFLTAVRPAFAVISVGTLNPHGHPHPDVVRRLASRGAMILRTDRDGQVNVRTDGRRIYVDTARWNRTQAALAGVF